jgi:hypothetical protein
MDITNGQKVYGEIVQKAWDDNQFKNNLMSNPVETIEKFTGNKMNLPEGQTLVVKDQTDESIVYLNIPRKIDTESLELTDEQLEMVAGGTDVLFWGGVTLGSIAMAAYLAGRDSKH